VEFNSEKPEFTVEGWRPVARLFMVLPSSRVSIRFVVPEGRHRSTNRHGTTSGRSSDIKIALEFFVASPLDVAGRTSAPSRR